MPRPGNCLGPVVQRLLKVVDLLILFPVKGDDALVPLVQHEFDRVDERNRILVYILENRSIVLLIHTVSLVEQPAQFHIYSHQFCKLTGCKGIGEIGASLLSATVMP